MKSNVIKIVIVLLLVFLSYFIGSRNRTIPVFNDFQFKLDSLEYLYNSVKDNRDTILTIIDSSKVEIIYIEKEYDEKYINITNASIADDIEFFTDYLSKAKPGLSNSNNSITIKTD